MLALLPQEHFLAFLQVGLRGPLVCPVFNTLFVLIITILRCWIISTLCMAAISFSFKLKQFSATFPSKLHLGRGNTCCSMWSRPTSKKKFLQFLRPGFPFNLCSSRGFQQSSIFALDFPFSPWPTRDSFSASLAPCSARNSSISWLSRLAALPVRKHPGKP